MRPWGFEREARTALDRSHPILPPLVTHHVTCPQDEAGQTEAQGGWLWTEAGWGLTSGPLLCYSLNGSCISKWDLIFLKR